VTVAIAAAPDDPRRRRTGPVDTSFFFDEVEAALDAFRNDVTYAVLMARAAVTITRKREVWQARRDLRERRATHAA
jgi:hypothetical protein